MSWKCEGGLHHNLDEEMSVAKVLAEHHQCRFMNCRFDLDMRVEVGLYDVEFIGCHFDAKNREGAGFVYPAPSAEGRKWMRDGS